MILQRQSECYRRVETVLQDSRSIFIVSQRRSYLLALTNDSDFMPVFAVFRFMCSHR
jgi:hypothetical protein